MSRWPDLVVRIDHVDGTCAMEHSLDDRSFEQQLDVLARLAMAVPHGSTWQVIDKTKGRNDGPIPPAAANTQDGHAETAATS